MTPYQHTLIETLSRGMLDLRGFVEHFPADRWDWQPSPTNWSVRRNLHHMRDTEQRYLERLEGVLREGEYVPSPVEQTEPDPAGSIDAILDHYAAARDKIIVTLRGLSAEEWATVFTHPTLWGAISVEWWAERVIEHSTDHLHNLWMIKQLAGVAPHVRERLTGAPSAAPPHS